MVGGWVSVLIISTNITRTRDYSRFQPSLWKRNFVLMQHKIYHPTLESNMDAAAILGVQKNDFKQDDVDNWWRCRREMIAGQPAHDYSRS